MPIHSVDLKNLVIVAGIARFQSGHYIYFMQCMSVTLALNENADGQHAWVLQITLFSGMAGRCAVYC
jgi:hypothetical protein